MLYYTVETAVNKISQYNFDAKLSTAAIITFTDGLDQGSLAMNTSMTTNQQYLAYLKNKISSTKVKDINLKAYTIGVEGTDVKDEGLFRENLESLASSPENAHRITDFNQIDEKFTSICDELIQKREQLILTISVPFMSDKEICRFTLDGASSAESSNVWIQGTFDRSTLSLRNIEYHGLSSVSGLNVTGVVNGLNIMFTFEDCRTLDGDILTISNKSNIAQWIYIQSTGGWQHNVEMADSDIDLEKRNSTAIMLLIDCSSSLGNNDFEKLKFTANRFIERLIGYYGKYNGVESVSVDDNDNIEEIDWSDAEYYNLQGVRIFEPSQGLYIRRIGKHSQKVYIP